MSHFRQFLLSGFVLTLALVTFVSAAPQTPPTGTATQNGDTVAGEFYKVWWRGNTAKDYKVTYSSSGLTNITVVTIYLVTLGGDEEYEFCTRTDSPSDSYPNAEASGNCKWDAAHQSIPDGNYEARVTISGSQSLTLYTDIFTIKTPPAGGTCTALTNVTGGPSTAATWTPLSATLNRGGSQTFRVWVTPDSSYMLSDVIVDPSDGPPESRGPVPAVSVACPATPDPIRNYTITAVVRLKDTTCKIRPSKLYYLGGVVNPPNETSLTLGQTYEAKADANSNWMIKTFSVNGQAVPDAAGQYIKTRLSPVSLPTARRPITPSMRVLNRKRPLALSLVLSLVAMVPSPPPLAPETIGRPKPLPRKLIPAMSLTLLLPALDQSLGPAVKVERPASP
mgnify:CR=1 FL=1